MKLGIPAVAVATEAFRALAEFEAKAWGWAVPIATMTHPLGGIPASEVEARAAQIVTLLRAGLAGDTATTQGRAVDEGEPRLEVPLDPWELYEVAQLGGWGDGLPVMAPTPDRVARMLAHAGVDPDAAVGELPPARLHVVAENVAVNAVLAGCADDAFPIVLAAVRACTQERFNLLGILATTHTCTATTIVSGPGSARLGMNHAASAFGPGNRANASIGRAVRLSLQNLGHAWPGPVDKSTQGSPAKFSFCFAENLVESPWPAYHVDRCFDPDDTTVTVIASEPPHNLHDPASTTAENLLQFIIGGMTHGGHNNLYHKGDLFLVLCPEHAGLLHAAGWTRERIRAEIFERATLDPHQLGREAFDHYVSRWPGQPDVDFDTASLSLAAAAEHINIVVAGGPGKHSSWLPGWGQSFSAIARV
jgi:hypothetical protein